MKQQLCLDHEAGTGTEVKERIPTNLSEKQRDKLEGAWLLEELTLMSAEINDLRNQCPNGP